MTFLLAPVVVGQFRPFLEGVPGIVLCGIGGGLPSIPVRAVLAFELGLLVSLPRGCPADHLRVV